MKIIHTADWHLGQTLFGADRTREHLHFLEWLLSTVRNERPDVLLIAGDVFDSSNPSASAEHLLWNFLDQVTQENPAMRVILTSGNHDSGSRLQAPAGVMRRIGVQVRGRLEHDEKGRPMLEDLMIPVNAKGNPEDQAVILAMPFLHVDDYEQTERPMEGMKQLYRELIKEGERRFKGVPQILTAHFFAVGSSFSTPEKDDFVVVGGQNAMDASEFSSPVAYTALGHIHKAQTVGGKDNIRYCGSALPMSFTEKSYTHGVNLVEIDSEGQAHITQIAYEPLRQLLTIPSSGVADFDEVMEQINALPKAEKNDDKGVYPFIQVKVHVTKYDPTMLASIQEAVSKKRGQLCRVERVRPDGEVTAGQLGVSSPEDLQKLIPATIAREAFKNYYGNDMPDDIARLVADIKRECENGEEA